MGVEPRSGCGACERRSRSPRSTQGAVGPAADADAQHPRIPLTSTIGFDDLATAGSFRIEGLCGVRGVATPLLFGDYYWRCSLGRAGFSCKNAKSYIKPSDGRISPSDGLLVFLYVIVAKMPVFSVSEPWIFYSPDSKRPLKPVRRSHMPALAMRRTRSCERRVSS